MSRPILTWHSYNGELVDDAEWKTRGFGFQHDRLSPDMNTIEVSNAGACFGFVVGGSAHLKSDSVEWTVRSMQWFSTSDGFKLQLDANTSVAIWQKVGFKGLYAMGGPVESTGRLRYIDGCTDTILCGPPRQGDPCLNLLHFPKHIDQTEHFHPSSRLGIVAKGMGRCEAENLSIVLQPGTIFFIPAGTNHRFVTAESELDVIAYHPDSDWGPADEDHPMINRTWIGNGQNLKTK